MIDNRQDFADYCLRQLGAGVINIEISDDQIEDNIGAAIQYYQEFHFDGIERDYIIRRITASTFNVLNTTGWVVGDDLTSGNVTTKITAIDGLKITVAAIRNGSLKNGDLITNGAIEKAVSGIVLGDFDNRSIPVDDSVFGVIRVLNINKLLNTTEYMFDAKYQIMAREIRNLTSGASSYLYGMLSYIGHLEFLLNKEKDFRFNRRMNRLVLDISWGTDLNIGDLITIEVYKALNEDTYGKILNDLWLKKYCTALFKRQWGNNLKKYKGLQLPGGVSYDGQSIYDEAVDEIKNLEQEANEQSAPLSFMVG